MADLKFTPIEFSENDRDAWVSGDYSLLASSRASSYLKRVLPRKAEKRRLRRATDRFFGEAFVATRVLHEFGYYGSFRWLTNPFFLTTPAINTPGTLTDRDELHRALWDSFGEAQLRSLHMKAGRVEAATGEKPAPPDLWLIDQKGEHVFCEVKLPGDRVRACQLAGLAVIAASLKPATGSSVRVEVFDLHPKDLGARRTEAFKRFCREAG